VSWYQEAVFYELYIRAFKDSSGDGNGDFRGAIEKLDYIQSLGVSCIWILPMYPSPLEDDGYDVADYRDIHPHYGTLEAFKAFLDAAHSRGLRVVTDLVMNHMSDRHPWFQRARQDRRSKYRDYYVWSDDARQYGEARIIFLDVESSNWTYDDVAGQYYWHRFYSSQPDLNYDNPAVHQEMFEIARFWLRLGIDGFRAGAVPYLYEREGINCENLPETHQFLKKLRQMMDEEFPDAILIAEANQWPVDLLPYFGAGDEFHLCFHFPIMPRLYQALKAGTKRPIIEILNATPEIPAGTQWMTFLRNHDELTLEMVTPAVRQWMWQQYAPEPRMRQNLGIRRRLAPLLENDRRKWRLLHALFLPLPGAPVIYYGDEIGLGDNIWLPDRHGCRTPMHWTIGMQGGFSAAAKTYFPPHSDEIYGYQVVNVETQEADPDSYLSVTRFLLSTRKQHGALRRGKLNWVSTGDDGILAYTRSIDSERILCLFNLTGEAREFIPRFELPATDLLASSGKLLHASERVQLPAYGAYWLA
jgi:maltose alpha-D-glucosyltransferase/alpha-amylase